MKTPKFPKKNKKKALAHINHRSRKSQKKFLHDELLIRKKTVTFEFWKWSWLTSLMRAATYLYEGHFDPSKKKKKLTICWDEWWGVKLSLNTLSFCIQLFKRWGDECMYVIWFDDIYVIKYFIKLRVFRVNFRAHLASYLLLKNNIIHIW